MILHRNSICVVIRICRVCTALSSYANCEVSPVEEIWGTNFSKLAFTEDYLKEVYQLWKTFFDQDFVLCAEYEEMW